MSRRAPPVGPKPAAASGGNRQAERRKSQGALARLCEFPGRGEIEIPPDPYGPSAARSCLKKRSVQIDAQSNFVRFKKSLVFCSGDALRWAQRADWGAHPPSPPSGLLLIPLGDTLSFDLPMMKLPAAFAKSRPEGASFAGFARFCTLLRPND